MNIKELWEAALGEIQLNISKANYQTWLKDTFILDIKDGTVFIGVPSSFTKEWLENKYHKQILHALYGLDSKIKKIEYLVTTNKDSLKKIETRKTKRSSTISKSSVLDEQLELNIDSETNLNPKYLFENFVVGTNNELANKGYISKCNVIAINLEYNKKKKHFGM